MTEHDERLKAIKARLDARTPGEWHVVHDAIVSDEGENRRLVAVINVSVKPDNDAAFIAHAPADMRWLLERVKVLEADNERLRVANLDLLSLRHGSIDARRVKVNEAIGQDGE